ncbi:MAG: thiamine diphosphokinase [bacterium]|nr:thiamine diphosphokinase [bacterium]
MKRFVIIGNGEIDDPEIIKNALRKSDIIIAVDGGYEHINKLPLKPDYLIGDLDSIKNLPKNNLSTRIMKYPRQKDETDTEIAIQFAIKNKASEILLFGMTSMSRIDHSLNNIFLLECLAEKGIINTLFVNSFTRLSVVKGHIKIYRKNGHLISLIPLSRKVKGITTSGLKFKLKNDLLSRDKARGISNIITSKEGKINFRDGILLVIQIIGKPE